MPRPLLHAEIKTRYPVSPDGYVRVRLDDGSINEEHRVVMTQALGRELEKWEVVRHINDDRADNDISNLLLDERGQGRESKKVRVVCASCGTLFAKDAKAFNAAIKRGKKHFFCGLACVGRSFGRRKKERVPDILNTVGS